MDRAGFEPEQVRPHLFGLGNWKLNQPKSNSNRVQESFRGGLTPIGASHYCYDLFHVVEQETKPLFGLDTFLFPLIAGYLRFLSLPFAKKTWLSQFHQRFVLATLMFHGWGVIEKNLGQTGRSLKLWFLFY